jgi:hypothetical protein
MLSTVTRHRNKPTKPQTKLNPLCVYQETYKCFSFPATLTNIDPK